MHQNMSHALNHFPFNFRMRTFEFLCEHIYCFTYYLNMFDKPVENNWVVFNIYVVIFTFIVEYNFNGGQNVFESSFVFNLFSHR